MMKSSSLTSGQLNFLQESGIRKSSVNGNLISSGFLATYVQKGLQFKKIEANLDTMERDLEEDAACERQRERQESGREWHRKREIVDKDVKLERVRQKA